MANQDEDNKSGPSTPEENVEKPQGFKTFKKPKIKVIEINDVTEVYAPFGCGFGCGS